MQKKMAGAKVGYGAGRRLMYGMAEFFGGGAFVVINTFFTVFLIKALGVPAALAGLVPLLGHFWDAVTDPMMGNITDRSQHRWGPKRFYILIGGFASVLTFILMWVPLPTHNNTGLFSLLCSGLRALLDRLYHPHGALQWPFARYDRRLWPTGTFFQRPDDLVNHRSHGLRHYPYADDQRYDPGHRLSKGRHGLRRLFPPQLPGNVFQHVGGT